MNDRLHIMFAGGGTGGHLYPGLAVAEELARLEPGVRVAFCSAGHDWERAVVCRHGYEYRGVHASPFVVSPMGLVRALYSNGIGYRAARQLVQSPRPDLVIGLGGYASIPLCLAAIRRHITLILLEQNLIPGRANRLLARWATMVCTTFAESAEYLCNRIELVHTGNPVRSSIVAKAAQRATDANQHCDVNPLLVVLGGSQGAHGVNQFLIDALPILAPHLKGWEVVHQAGNSDADSVRAAYERHQVRCRVESFIEDMAAIYARATLAISRAGATTLAELAVCGIPSILLPYPYATADHQWHNGQAFRRAGAAIVVDQKAGAECAMAASVSFIVPLLRVPELRREMRLAMLRLARPDAASSIASQILRLAHAAPAVPRSA